MDKRQIIDAPQSCFCFPMQVRFQEVDGAGIVFFARVLEFFHDAYAARLAEGGLPLPEILDGRAWIAPIKHAEADYLRPMRFGDRIDVEMPLLEIEGATTTIAYRLRRAENREITAVGHTVHVYVDRATMKRLDEVPDEARRALETIRKG